jgi:actin-related protein 9
MDLVQTRYGDITVTLGKERHRFCEPLFDAQVQARIRNIDSSSAIPVQEGVHLAIRGVDVDYRLKVWDGLFITGEISSVVKGEAVLVFNSEH